MNCETKEMAMKIRDINWQLKTKWSNQAGQLDVPQTFEGDDLPACIKNMAAAVQAKYPEESYNDLLWTLKENVDYVVVY